jgi:hypothetical protein
MVLLSVMVTCFGINNQIEQGDTAVREDEEEKNKAGCNCDSDRDERGPAKLGRGKITRLGQSNLSLQRQDAGYLQHGLALKAPQRQWYAPSGICTCRKLQAFW